jgi:phosphate uptake regulator
MELISERKLFKIGEGGYAITLPKTWIKYNRLKAGDIVEVLADKNITVRVKPKLEEKLI